MFIGEGRVGGGVRLGGGWWRGVFGGAWNWVAIAIGWGKGFYIIDTHA